MRSIHMYIDHINEELEGAREYAEKYIDFKARGHTARSNSYKSMAQDELRHAGMVYEFAAQDMEAIERIYTIPEELQEAWEHFGKHYADCTAKIKMMLA